MKHWEAGTSREGAPTIVGEVQQNVTGRIATFESQDHRDDVLSLISQAEPERKGLEECAREIRKIFVAAGEYDWFQQQKSDVMVIEILRTLAPECHIEAAAEEILKTISDENLFDSKVADYERLGSFRYILRKHFREAIPPIDINPGPLDHPIEDSPLEIVIDEPGPVKTSMQQAAEDVASWPQRKRDNMKFAGGGMPEPVGEVGFEKELESLINKHSKENESDTPDFILAEYISQCLSALNRTVHKREAWYGRKTEAPEPTPDE